MRSVREPGGAPTGGDPERRLRKRRVIAAVATAALAGATVIGVIALRAGQESPTRAEAARSGERGVEYEAWDGGRASTAQFRGKPLVINFWASWCPSCLAVIPDYVKVYERYKDEVTFLGINTQDDPAEAQRLRKELGITYPVGRDSTGEVFAYFGGTTLPLTVFIDEEGEVVDTSTTDLYFEDLAKKVRELSDGKGG